MFLALIFFPLTCFDWVTLRNNIILKQHLQILKVCSQIYSLSLLRTMLLLFTIFLQMKLFLMQCLKTGYSYFYQLVLLSFLVTSIIFQGFFGKNSTENNFCVTIQHAFFKKFSNFLSVLAYALLGKVHMKYINIFLFIITYMRKNFLRIIFFSKEERLSNCKLNL